jgi:ABC-type uncharacterized transport system involved in gliding motility auxiliary subunit
MLNRRLYAAFALAIAVAVFFAVNIAANSLTSARLDLTQNHQFTLSDGTRAVLAKLDRPLTLTFYYSRQTAAAYAPTAAYAGRVRDLLADYVRLSQGKIILKEVDPEPYTPEEDAAAAAGLTPAPTQSGDVVYFGLAAAGGAAKDAIAYFAPDREPYLEYDLSSLVWRLSHPRKPVLGVLTALPLAGNPQTGQAPNTMWTALSQNYQVQQIDPGFLALPAGLDLLVIAQPAGLNAAQQGVIDRFVRGGGRALVFADPMPEMLQGPADTGLGPLLAGWGVNFDAAKVVLDRSLAQRVATSADPRTQSLAYPLWLHLTPDNFDARDPITANLQNLNLASVGALTAAKGAAPLTALLTSSDQAALVPVVNVMAAGDPDHLMQLAAPGNHMQILAARLAAPLHVVVIADSDVLDDKFWVHPGNALVAPEPFSDNGGLVLNAVENLTGSGDLIALRTRANTDRPFTRVRAMQAEAEARFRETLQTLQTRLAVSQQQLQQLQPGNGGALTPQQQAAIARLRGQMADTRTQLRDVQHNLRADIDRLGAWLAFYNILAVPLLVIGFAMVQGWMRRARRRRAAAA